MKLLFITQKLHQQDAFGLLWIRAFARRGYDVTVLCLENRMTEGLNALGEGDAPIDVLSLGKESGSGRLTQILRFEKLIITTPVDRVFAHMSPVWYALGWWWWLLRGTPVYLWYTHYAMQLGVLLFGWFGRRFFCATPQSLPQYDGSPKKVVTGHGIDMGFWIKRGTTATDPKKLLVVHRLSRSKRLEIILHALTLLPGYSVEIYGIEAEADYAREMRELTVQLKLEQRVHFRGTIAAKELPALYASHRLILNMASETIDKTMLEAMTCGCYPVTTKRNAQAIGIPAAPEHDTPEALAAFVERFATTAPMGPDEMYRIVKERHGLDRLIALMDSYIAKGA